MAGVKWGEAWGGHSQQVAGLEVGARFGGEETGLKLRQEYHAGAHGLTRAATAVSEGCAVFADACGKESRLQSRPGSGRPRDCGGPRR